LSSYPVGDIRSTDPSRQVIGLAIEVHRHLGPELLENVYKECLCFELHRAGIPYIRQQKLPIRYKGLELNCRYQTDLVVDNCLVVEVKAVGRIEPVQEAQLLTYLRLSGHAIGLLLNFICDVLKEAIRRRRV